MGSYITLLLAYIVGGLTFLPLLLCAIVLHAYLTFPEHPSSHPQQSHHDPLRDSNDDGQNLKSEQALAELAAKFRGGHEPDVAAGYFAVCREYVPGGVNGKPPERTTPAGEIVATESPSVYQSMYRSLFDRKQGPTLDPGKGNGKPVKRARNVFFVVLRHGHLMLYDDSEQLEVRHVISLEHHHVGIDSGGDEIPEGELWIKRNAIRLERKKVPIEVEVISKPFLFFTENCSDKEDFYFALLQNQEGKPDASDNPPRPQHYQVKHIIGLVQQLHSSEEQLQTRWVNALVGRLFLAIYKTQTIEDFVRKKITKKIARAKKPAFLSGIVLQKMDMGESAPFITNPKLKDLTIDGDCCAEAEFRYNGGLRLEIAATARIDLGARFKAREVNLVLAVVIKKLHGHAMLKFKPSPSNRVWVTFEKMPNIELAIEPIVSSRQITYNIILKAIESRIREVIAETIVLPHWDDSPFTDTTGQRYRGGIWARSKKDTSSAHTSIPDEVVEDEAESVADPAILPSALPTSLDDRTASMPALVDSSDSTVHGNESNSSTTSIHSEDSNEKAFSSGTEKLERLPKSIRSRSFASAADPLVVKDNANGDRPKHDTKDRQHHDATSTMIAISQRSRPTSPGETPAASPSKHPTDHSRTSSIASITSDTDGVQEQATTTKLADGKAKPSSTTATELQSPQRSFSDAYATTPPEKRQTVMSLGAATAAAKTWSLGVWSRRGEQRKAGSGFNRAGTPEHPIGRGRPLPPPGEPLPFPERPSTKVSNTSPPKRKPVPAPIRAASKQDEATSRSSPAPSLPPRRRQRSTNHDTDVEGLLVIKAPRDSEPSSPTDSAHADSLKDAPSEAKDEHFTTHTPPSEVNPNNAPTNGPNGRSKSEDTLKSMVAESSPPTPIP